MKIGLITNNQIKILACIFMLIDHIGFFLFPDVLILRIIGRLAMPLFAFCIAEGAYYTKNKIKYFCQISGLGALICLFILIFNKKLDLNILISFSLSLLMIFLFDNIRKYIYLKNKKYTIFFILLFIIYTILIFIFIYYIHIEYSSFGIIIPFVLSLTQSKYYKNPNPSNSIIKAFAFIISFILCMIISYYFIPINTDLHIEQYGLLSTIFILLYNGKRGNYNLKYLFYIFYPLHVIILYLISYLM